jgi:hypothetical protein
MNLSRLDSNPHGKDNEWPDDHVQQSFAVKEIEGDFPVDESSMVRVPFPRFDRGTERQSDFAVDINWLDTKNLISKFIDETSARDASQTGAGACPQC